MSEYNTWHPCFPIEKIILCGPAKHQSHSGTERRHLYARSLVCWATTDRTSPFPSWLPPFPRAQQRPIGIWHKRFLLHPFPPINRTWQRKNPWMSSHQRTQLEMAHLESKSIGTLSHQRRDGSREGMSPVTCHGTWESRALGIYLLALQEWRRQSPPYHN